LSFQPLKVPCRTLQRQSPASDWPVPPESSPSQ
jgi:hypothetical protein